MPPEPLPPLHELPGLPLQGNADVQTAYQRLLPLQNEPNCVKVTLLGWMLVYAPYLEGRNYIAQGINACTDDVAVVELGYYYLKSFTGYLKANFNRALATPPSYPLGDVEELRQHMIETFVAPPQSHAEAKQQVLVRDNFSCVVTRSVDTKSYLNSPGLQKTMHQPVLKRMQCSHILPSHVTRGLDKPIKLEDSSHAATILSTFGGIDAPELHGENIHKLENILTLQVGVRDAFDALEIWFEPVEGIPNRYSIQRQHPYLWTELPPQITFTSPAPHLALPSPRYLAIHAACAKVLQKSGAVEVIHRILDGYEDTSVLANDGSSSELLDYALFGSDCAGLASLEAA